ncbi:MAG TPA: tetratricopeptide repeat protein [Bryobacteraceae bacterium]|nr:tetratricopeptide repeat protein [Bryobacteraceae bacterium]HOQ45207.1 tetratricopeptide repeat protein [Bryobacteraceae bacterium]HPQ14320.1 tetratricopeptide repeat protein [Bryobacteraceae bacterium]HPU71279.1 tetratricopeptide repeat protein [Bryobacteraceae bacterium]
MNAVLEALTGALEHHQAGRFEEAEAIYRRILASDPTNVDALHLLGMALAQTGRRDPAIDLIGRAIAANPAIPAFHNNLGTVLQAEGRIEEAVRSFRRALDLDPAYAEAHINLANCFQSLKLLDQAVAHYREALRLKPGFAEAHNNLGNALAALGQAPEAIACYYEAVRLKPGYAEAWVNLGAVLKEQGRLEEAASCGRRAIECRQDLAEAHSNLAAVLVAMDRFEEAEAEALRALELKPLLAEANVNLAAVRLQQRRLEEAAACARRAIELKPEMSEAHMTLGDVFIAEERAEEALACYRRALELKPHGAEQHNKVGYALQRLGQFREALERFEEAVRLAPKLVDAHVNRAMAWLQAGDFERGWAEYEWRWRSREFSRRVLPRPRWDGSAIPGRTILLHAEQGLGDTVQFVRYVPLVKAVSQARVVLECQPRLVPLLETIEGVDEIVPAGSPLPDYDVHAPLLSLPGILGVRPARVPYLRVPPERIERARLDAGDRFRVGLAWAGNPKHRHDRARSIRLSALARLAEVPYTAFYSLQRGPGSEQLEDLPPGFEVTALERESGDILDTAAAILNLDLVITVDSLIGHLAGALGKPVCILLETSPDWRWRLGTDHSEWYPTARLFRQTRRGDWDDVVERAAAQLHLAVAHHLLARGQFEAGWKEYEWRWKAGGVSPDQFPQPQWDGSPLQGKRILLWAEQSLGDTIQFVRFAPQVKAAGGKVFLECQPELAGLLASAPGVDGVIPYGAPLPGFDVQLPLQSLPRVLKTTPETIPSRTPYLQPDPALVERWRERLGNSGKLRVGLCWADNPKQANDRSRSMPASEFNRLADVPGVELFSLQYGPKSWELSGIPVRHLGGQFRDVADTAAAIANLDLVISVDTMIAHLAGALGKPVWVLLSEAADWCYPPGRGDTPWYPGMRLFRQTQPGGWAEVMERVAEALRNAGSR